MNEEKFWLEFWKIIGMVTVAIVFIASVWIHSTSSLWYNSWNKCIEKGGEPKEIAIVGNNNVTFTCDLPQ